MLKNFQGLIVICLVFVSSMAQASLLCSDVFRVLRPAGSSYVKFEQILQQNRNATFLNEKMPLVETAFGTDVPIVHSFEAEGLELGNIRRWFSEARPSFKSNMKAAFEKELKGPPDKQKFLRWLAQVKVRSDRMVDDMVDWGAMNLRERLNYFLDAENPLQLITSTQADALFETRAVTYDDITTNDRAPKGVTVGDDLGSWEVRSSVGQVNRADFLKLRTKVEDFLDQKVGHQHLFHAWPESKAIRQELAPYYIELLDSTTWYLYWRQMRRTDTDINRRTVVDHPYLGVYSTSSLQRLQNKVEDGDSKAFRDKYRLVGARNFPAVESVPEQKGDVPDWEIRSGNKGVMRDFVEASLESRLVTGDYKGLKAFGSYQFNTKASIFDLTRSYITRADVEALERFEELHPMMSWGTAHNAKNNFRTKIVAPLFAWENRFDLNYKMQIYKQAQAQYARSLADIAREYVKVARQDVVTRKELLEARKKSMTRIKRALRKFSATVRLDLDGELYLKPRAEKEIPSIQVPTKGPIDVNQVDLGIEYSMRLPQNMEFQSLEEAQKGILSLAQKFAMKMNYGAPVSLTQDGHGHGIAVKYNVPVDAETAWRFEWDGIQRDYVDGQVVRAYNGHIEIVTPKFSPQSIQGPVLELYKGSRGSGLLPRRNAGGAHINFDLAPLKQLPPEQGTRALLNLVSYFESNRDLILFLWQHPRRVHAAFPVTLTSEMASRFKTFHGDWKDLGRMLYETRYFNTAIGRKPKYVPLNLTAVMTPILPKEYYEKTLDIKNKEQAWFPNFAKVYSRGEARFFDAPTDEVMAALHVKYFRALMQKTLNSESPIALAPRFDAKRIEQWKKNPALWISDAEKHLQELGLEPSEFRSLLWDSYMNQKMFEPRSRAYERYKDYLPAAG